jgi:hypothetical protein
VLTSTSTLFQCPPASLFFDFYNGLFGPFARSSYESVWYFPVAVSTAQFECVSCPPSHYAVGAGLSDGVPKHWQNPTCRSCPFGANCLNGSIILAAEGFWGSLVNDTDVGVTISFSRCPEDYCSGARDLPLSFNACSGHRTGVLCGSCLPGYSESVGSATCRRRGACDDGAWVFPLLVLGVLLGGCIMNRNGELWCPRPERPTIRGRLASYYFQVGAARLSLPVCACSPPPPAL